MTEDTAQVGNQLDKRKTWKREFILNLREHGIEAVAAKQTGVRLKQVAYAKKSDPRFLEYVNEAIATANGELELIAREQAIGGSERLMIKLLEGNLPEKYGKASDTYSTTYVKAYVGFTPDLWDVSQAEAELTARGKLAETNARVIDVVPEGTDERDTEHSSIPAVAVADQAVAG